MVGNYLLTTQKNIFLDLDNKILCTFQDANTLVAQNISESDLIVLKLIVNNPIYGGTMYLSGVDVFLDGDHVASNILGLYDILNTQINRSNSSAFTQGYTYQLPFLTGFQCGSVNELVTQLSELTQDSPNAKGIKKYTLTFKVK